jgi:hypothetical protein
VEQVEFTSPRITNSLVSVMNKTCVLSEGKLTTNQNISLKIFQMLEIYFVDCLVTLSVSVCSVYGEKTN